MFSSQNRNLTCFPYSPFSMYAWSLQTFHETQMDVNLSVKTIIVSMTSPDIKAGSREWPHIVIGIAKLVHDYKEEYWRGGGEIQ